MTLQRLKKRLETRRPNFLAVPGLIQKIYGRDPETGKLCGIYFFHDSDSADTFLQSDLAKTIPITYEATALRKERYEVLFPVDSERGPI
ncbi:YdhR family protein [Halioxenophilus sp. WMMB6]|uniref:YdhR family protein n=1 Tax=Halioxenophilus sp. WMMB6 TaxID=3073815 RepID=UPI00295F49A1|nr:YdhR family protein [Halioxenophilus sp. WMMB6]